MAMTVQNTFNANPAKGFSGQLASRPDAVLATAQNGEASASIPFGKAVVWDPSTPAHDVSVTLPANQADKVYGIVVFSQKYMPAWTDNTGAVHGQLDSVGLNTGTWFEVLRKGRILVTAASAVTPGDRLWVRRTAGIGESLGALEDATDSTDMIDCTNQGVWMSTAAAGELAWLEVDFTNFPTVA